MSYIVHKAIELKNIRKSSELARKQALDPTYMARTFWRQLKYDGCNCVVVSYGNGDFDVFSRTGEKVYSMQHLAVSLGRLPAGVYLGEAWHPLMSFPEISGTFRRKKVKTGERLLKLCVFDMLTLEEWEEGRSVYPYFRRWARLTAAIGARAVSGGGSLHTVGLEHIRPALTWQPDADTFDVVERANSDSSPENLALELQDAGGYDGIILRDPEGTWTKGDEGGNGEIIKVKPRIRVSCKVTGYLEGKGKHAGTIGTLLVEYNGKEQGAGTGLKDHERDITCFGMSWRNKIVEIEALGVTADGFLREPVLLGLRDDVLEAD